MEMAMPWIFGIFVYVVVFGSLSWAICHGGKDRP